MERKFKPKKIKPELAWLSLPLLNKLFLVPITILTWLMRPFNTIAIVKEEIEINKGRNLA